MSIPTNKYIQKRGLAGSHDIELASIILTNTCVHMYDQDHGIHKQPTNLSAIHAIPANQEPASFHMGSMTGGLLHRRPTSAMHAPPRFKHLDETSNSESSSRHPHPLRIVFRMFQNYVHSSDHKYVQMFVSYLSRIWSYV